MRVLIAPLFLCAWALVACSDDPVTGDSGLPPGDVGFVDSGNPQGDSGPVADTGADAGFNADANGNADALPGDTGDGGTPLPLEMVPGSHVTFAAGRIDIMMDDYASVVALLGQGTRGTGNAVRTYAWTVAGAEVTIWFANSNLDNDDVPPTNVDGTDRVLWIAIGTGYAGRTPDNVGLDSTKAQVEAAYGVAPKESPIPAPMNGVLAQYYTRGLLVAYDTGSAVRTITIARDYLLAPDAEIDVQGPRLRFPGFDLEGYGGGVSVGTSRNNVTSRLGDPDAQGSVNIGGQNLDTLSYAFIGLEVFFLGGSNNTLFLTVHTPYYGTTGTGEGIGTTRTAFETYLSGRGYSAPMASSNAQFFCYEHGSDQDVGVSYSTDVTPIVTSITFPLLNCP